MSLVGLVFGDAWNWIFMLCVLGCGITSYLMGVKEGVKAGAGAMYEALAQTGKPNPDDPNTVIVELEKNSS
jgi:hypothetical protein